MKIKICILITLYTLMLTLTGAYDTSGCVAVYSPYCDIDSFEAAPRVVEIRLVNERVRTHHWEYSLSDETVLACVGTQIKDNYTQFAFSGRAPGVCDVTFEYTKRYAEGIVLITEVYRFYVDPDLGVTCEHIHFSSNET